jgi:alpha-amylase/alpha-mannosidase (GH57 family)
MKHWSMALHFYQPPTQDPRVTKSILESCYLPLLRTLSKKSGFGLTLNVSGSLLLQLENLKANEFFELTKSLIQDKKVEIVNSVIYHPLIPLIPNDVVVRQIKKNAQTLKNLLGVETINGFFPPELAVDENTLNLLDSAYVFIDEGATEKFPLAKYDNKYLLVNNHDVCDLLRAYPKELHAETVVNLVNKNCGEENLIVTVNDAELFGHHYSERLQVLSDLLDSDEIKFITASEAIIKFGNQAPTVSSILPSTWQDCKNFDLWNKNILQKKYLKLLKLVYKSISNNQDTEIQDLFDQGTSSCYLYWLSNWPWWHPALVQKGATCLIKSTKNAEALKIYKSFLDEMWAYHKSGKVESKYKEYDKKILPTINERYTS